MKQFREYKAPTADQSVFADPPLSDVDDLLQSNLDTAASHPDWLKTLREQGRSDLLDSATRYSSAYADVAWLEDRNSDRIVMAGHQPALFHPGVWFKNFALSTIARKHQAIPINLIVDNDVGSGSSVRVPTLDRSAGRIRYDVVDFAAGNSGVPYEQTEIKDRELFESFGDRLAEAVHPIVDDPAIVRLWPHAKAAIRRCGFAGCAMAQARHALESELGNQTLEIPVGVVSRGKAFAEFVIRLINDLDRFVDVYNRSLIEYRQAHGIRSSAHPVPKLAIETDDEGRTWSEAPLWIYGDDNPMRRQVWLCRMGDSVELSDRQGASIRFSVNDKTVAVDALTSQVGPNLKLRPRALITTMFARLVLSDLFLHGIGGGKYDQLGDMISGEFFSITPPRFMVLSATIRLPIASDSPLGVEPGKNSGLGRIRRQLRDTIYQPERFVDDVKLPQGLIEQKRSLLRSIPPEGPNSRWHHQMTRINERLAAELADVRDRLQSELSRAASRQSDLAILNSREHSFAMHPLASTVQSFQRMLADV